MTARKCPKAYCKSNFLNILLYAGLNTLEWNLRVFVLPAYIRHQLGDILSDRFIGRRHTPVAILVLAVLSLLLVQTRNADAQDPGERIYMIAAELAGKLDDDPASSYNVLLKEILPDDTYYFQYRQYPANRALRDLSVKKRVCFFPASTYSIAGITEDMLIQSDAIDFVSAHLFTAPGQTLINSHEDIRDKKVALQVALDPDYFFNVNVPYEQIRTPNDWTALKMLFAGRVDAMFGWFPDTYIITEKMGMPLPHFDPTLKTFQLTTHVVCKKFGGAEDLIAVISERIQALKKQKRLRKILGPHARIVGIDVPEPPRPPH